MKILLVQSYLGGNEPLVYPIGLACIKSSFSCHDVRILDTNLSANPFQELSKILKNFLPDVVGLSLRNIDSTNKREVVFYYSYFKETIDVINESSSAKIVVGGSGFSMYAKEIMENEDRIDYGVLLEGEVTFSTLLQNLDSPENVKSVFYRKDKKVVFTGTGKQVDLNCINYPDRQSVPLGAYKEIPEAIGIETKRGCILNCIYCIYGFLNGKQIRLRDPKRVVDEIEFLVNEHGLESFTFVDSVFNIPIDHAENICKELVRRKLKVVWSAWFNEKGLKTEFVELARDAGCKNIIFSPDGFSDKTLEDLGKNIVKEDILKSNKILEDVDGVDVSYNFFKNPPGQNLTSFLSLLLFCVKAKMQMGKRVHFEFNSIRVEPHTKLYELALKEGFVKKGESLLEPKYYTNRSTWYIEKIFNTFLRLRGK